MNWLSTAGWFAFVVVGLMILYLLSILLFSFVESVEDLLTDLRTKSMLVIDDWLLNVSMSGKIIELQTWISWLLLGKISPNYSTLEANQKYSGCNFQSSQTWALWKWKFIEMNWRCWDYRFTLLLIFLGFVKFKGSHAHILYAKSSWHFSNLIHYYEEKEGSKLTSLGSVNK